MTNRRDFVKAMAAGVFMAMAAGVFMAMAALMKFTSPSHIMFGTDYPQEPIESTTKHLPENGLSSELLHAIDRGNAALLLPKFKA